MIMLSHITLEARGNFSDREQQIKQIHNFRRIIESLKWKLLENVQLKESRKPRVFI